MDLSCQVSKWDMADDGFRLFRENTVGYNHMVQTPCGSRQMIYADWTASGRLYGPIEANLRDRFGPYVANTHSESSFTGRLMTAAYHHAAQRIKAYVNANSDDVLLPCGTGSTGAINKLQRILGMRVHEKLVPYTKIAENDRPVVFLTHMEHHSNHTSWLETIADVICLPANDEGLVDPDALRQELDRYATRSVKIGSFTACSNVTGIMTPYYELAKIMHQKNGWCFVDFAASAPYLPIDMHPSDAQASLDAIFISPHKFLGGPGSSGLLVFNRKLYENKVPDNPGGGTVVWTNPWGGREYIESIELREDGGTPGFLQLIRAALAFELKEQLLQANMVQREQQIVAYVMPRLKQIPHLTLLAHHVGERLAVFSFYFDHLHYNLVVRLLNDRFGIQARGGCSCAGTYGHFLLNVDLATSKSITDKIAMHDLTCKPGWVRISLHPMMTNQEMEFILLAVGEISEHGSKWAQDYDRDVTTNEFIHKRETPVDVRELFRL